MSIVSTVTKEGSTVVTINGANIEYTDPHQFEITNNDSDAAAIAVGGDYIYIDNDLSNLY